MDESISITLLGCGVVGSGVVKILSEQRDLLRQRAGVSFDVRHVVVRDPARHPDLRGAMPMTTDAVAAIDDPRVQVVVELMGGFDPAFQHIQRALRLGKPVVTANKSLLAERGPELFAAARKHNTCIAFEASCGGGIPIIDALCKGLVANRVDALVGIVNGTCNVILTQMSRSGWTYDQALAEAQRMGFAESDPAMDVSGRDAAQKLALLASLAFNVQVSESDIHVEGIERIEPADIHLARELGYVIKLLAIAQRSEGNRLTLGVHPALVHCDNVLSDVSGGFNAISVFGHALGHALFYGRGAGQMPTASAVVSDLVGVALGTVPQAFMRLKIFPDVTARADVLPFEQIETRYYLRLTARDVPGVLAEIAAALGRNGISLSAVMQHEQDRGQHVPVVITTHKSREGSMRQALKEIDALQTVRPPTVCLRIMDQPAESSF
jgi:homoserine dehydrogenase